jgi:hypothetical protein
LPNVRILTLGKALFAGFFFAERPVPSATLGKRFAECLMKFAECFRHSANTWFPVVFGGKKHGPRHKNKAVPLVGWGE